MLTLLLGVLLIAALVVQLIPAIMHSGVFGHSVAQDTLLGAVIGSIATAQPVVSYIFGGELQKAGINLMAVTALVMTWVTVGVVSLPVESGALGARFAIWRNIWAFVGALVASVLTVGALHVIE